MTLYIVSSGQISNGITLHSSDFMTVASGGTAVATVDSGGRILVAADATASTTTVISGGILSDSGTTLGTKLKFDGFEIVLSNGLASGTVVSSGGKQLVGGGGAAGAVARGTVLSSGGLQDVGIGGVVSGNVVSAGGSERIFLSGVASGTIVSSGGNQSVFSGGVARGTQLIGQATLSGGLVIGTARERVLAGGVTSGTVVHSGGDEIISSGGVASSTTLTGATLSSGGKVFPGAFEVVLAHGVARNTAVGSGGGVSVRSGGVASSTLVGSGGTELVSSGGRTSGTVVSAGGTERVSAGGIASKVVISAGGREIISSGGSATLTTLKPGGTIELAFLPFVSGGKATLNSTTDVLTVTEGGHTYSQKLAGKYTGERFILTAATSSGGTDVTIPCFAAGTLIRTTRGEAAVETLAIGDRVVTDGGERPIVWIGERRVDCRSHPRPELVWPIRIRAGAFTEEKPRRDLLLSPGHSVFCDGVLIPAEHLINGATIVQERLHAVDYVHVELDRHDVVLAEDLPVESYLDDGNRSAFANGAAELTLHPDFIPRGWDDACAPRCTEGPPLVAARRLLHVRALEIGYRVATGGGLRLLSDGLEVPAATAIGTRGRLFRSNGTLRRFVLPPGARELRILTPATVPAWIDPDSVDRRELGARIGAVYLDGRIIPLRARWFGAGFHPVERHGGERWRWTDGDARLHLPHPTQEAITLDLFVRNTMRHWCRSAEAITEAA